VEILDSAEAARTTQANAGVEWARNSIPLKNRFYAAATPLQAQRATTAQFIHQLL
jgi:hypothetical protein